MNESTLLFGFLGALLPIALGLSISWIWSIKARDAEAAYTEALTAFRARPTDPELRQVVIDKGREYTRTMTKQSGYSWLVEAALKNDLAVTTPAPLVTPVRTAESRLLELQSLRHKGLIDEEEHHQRRAEILAEV